MHIFQAEIMAVLLMSFLQVPGVLIIDTPGHATCRFCLFLFF